MSARLSYTKEPPAPTSSCRGRKNWDPGQQLSTSDTAQGPDCSSVTASDRSLSQLLLLCNLPAICPLPLTSTECPAQRTLARSRQSLREMTVIISTMTVLFPTHLHLPMQGMWVWSLGWEDPRSRKWQPTPVLLPGKVLWTEESSGLHSPQGHRRVGHT